MLLLGADLGGTVGQLLCQWLCQLLGQFLDRLVGMYKQNYLEYVLCVSAELHVCMTEN